MQLQVTTLASVTIAKVLRPRITPTELVLAKFRAASTLPCLPSRTLNSLLEYVTKAEPRHQMIPSPLRALRTITNFLATTGLTTSDLTGNASSKARMTAHSFKVLRSAPRPGLACLRALLLYRTLPPGQGYLPAGLELTPWTPQRIHHHFFRART